MRNGLLPRSSLNVTTPQFPGRGSDILVLAENSPEGPVVAGSNGLGTRGSGMTWCYRCGTDVGRRDLGSVRH